jgi:hypothetical protein
MDRARESSLPTGPADFAGDWTLLRRIRDARAGVEGTFTGAARLSPMGRGLRYDERGRLDLPGQPSLEATRSYLWHEAGPGRIEILHDDGRPFHSFALGPVAEAEHACPPDLYRVSYDFSRWPDWSATWVVSGPRKDYTSVTDYRRAGQGRGRG